MLANPDNSGSWPLFQFRGITVLLHWSWILVAIYQIDQSRGAYPHFGWDIAQYLSLFAIVLLHEFGHAFASRQVGGTANRILLWPFGGIAYVNTPQRPGAYLWAIAAGPLVNVLLLPILYGLSKYFLAVDDTDMLTPLAYFWFILFWINNMLLIFNLLPVLPMDGGQIFRALLWYKLGPIKSLRIAAWTGLVLGGCAIAVALFYGNFWMALVIGLMVSQSWGTIKAIRPQLPPSPH